MKIAQFPKGEMGDLQRREYFARMLAIFCSLLVYMHVIF